MIFEIAVGDKLRTVGIVRKGGLLHVDLDGRTHIVDARRISDSVVSMLVQLDGRDGAVALSIDRTPFDSSDLWASGAIGDFDVHLDGAHDPQQIRPAGSFGRQKKAGPARRRPDRSASRRRCPARSCACSSSRATT